MAFSNFNPKHMNQLQSPGHKKAYLQVPPLLEKDIPMLQKHSRDRSIRIPKANCTEMIKKVWVRTNFPVHIHGFTNNGPNLHIVYPWQSHYRSSNL